MLQKRGIMENLFNYISIEKFKERRYKRKEVIHAEGEKCNEFSVVLSGQVLISTFTEPFLLCGGNGKDLKKAAVYMCLLTSLTMLTLL